MKTENDTPEVQALSQADKLLRIRALVAAAIEETERLFGVPEGFPITVEFARVYDQIDKMILGEVSGRVN